MRDSRLDFGPTQASVAREMLGESTARRPFLAFCKTEVSLENPACALCIAQYRAQPDMRRASAIYNVFLESDATQAVNVNRTLALNVNTRLIRNQLSPDLFDEVDLQVLVNISDTYSRFQFTYEGMAITQRHNSTTIRGRHVEVIGALSGLARSFNRNAGYTSTAYKQLNGYDFTWPADWDEALHWIKNAGFSPSIMEM